MFTFGLYGGYYTVKEYGCQSNLWENTLFTAEVSCPVVLFIA